MSGQLRYEIRQRKLRRKMAESGLEGIVLTAGPNLKYYTGVTTLLLDRPLLLFIPRDDEPHLIAPKLELETYRNASFDIIVHPWEDGRGPGEAFVAMTSQLEVKGKWGVEGRVPFRFISYLNKVSKSAMLADSELLLQDVRAEKEQNEIQLLKKAASILCKSFLRIPEMMNPGVTESILARKLVEEIYSNGAETVEDVLVQSGERSAQPHALPSRKKIRKGESILINVACGYSGYYADIARTFILGNSRKFEDLYGKVLETEGTVIGAVESGKTVGSIDKVARDKLTESALGEYFIHRTGHGVGLEVLEAPSIAEGGTEVLRPSMTFTIEPGVYLPGRLGIRIQDEVLTRRKGHEVLSEDLPKEYGWWN